MLTMRIMLCIISQYPLAAFINFVYDFKLASSALQSPTKNAL